MPLEREHVIDCQLLAVSLAKRFSPPTNVFVHIGAKFALMTLSYEDFVSF